MERILLDFSQFSGRSALHRYLKKQFTFPDYYGENLDALYDCLTSYMKDVEIVFSEDEDGTCCEAVWSEEAPVQDEEMKRYLKKVRRVIEDAAEENSHLHL